MARFKEGSRAAAQEGTRNVAEVTFFDHMPPERSAADTIVHVGVLVGPYTCHIMSQVFNESLRASKHCWRCAAYVYNTMPFRCTSLPLK